MKIGLCGYPHRRGLAFTLAEVLIAVAVVGITFVSLYAGIYFCFGITRFERENLRATQIMLERMEGIRLFNWAQVTNNTLNPQNFTCQYYPGVAGVGAASGITYTGRVQFANANLGASSYSSKVLKVTVSVSWVSGNVPRNRSFSTLVAEDGVQNYVWANEK